MLSAYVAEKAIAQDLQCSGCGNPIIKEGQFKCLRCSPHRLVLATLNKQDIVCSRHEKPIVLMRYDRKLDQYRAYCQKRGCPNHKARIGTPIPLEETNMSQEREVVAAEEAKKSKTQELRDWLDGEIQEITADIDILNRALKICPNWTYADFHGRYGNLISSERNAKTEEDRKKLAELQGRLELLRSARELDVDIDAMEKVGITVNRIHSHEAVLEGLFGDESKDNHGFKFRFDMERRTAQIVVWAQRDLMRSEHYLEKITLFYTRYGHWPSWYYKAGDREYELSVNFAIASAHPGRKYLTVRDYPTDARCRIVPYYNTV